MRSLLGFFILVAFNAVILWAQEPDPRAVKQEDSPAVLNFHDFRNFSPRFKERALVVDINARVVEENQVVIWNESHQKTTIPGHPVGIKLVGSNIIVAVQFTPYVRRGVQKFLVAQGQTWMDIPGQGIRYHTSMQTIPLEFGEPIYFFPLGPQKDEDAASIEVMITLHPYEED